MALTLTDQGAAARKDVQLGTGKANRPKWLMAPAMSPAIGTSMRNQPIIEVGPLTLQMEFLQINERLRGVREALIKGTRECNAVDSSRRVCRSPYNEANMTPEEDTAHAFGFREGYVMALQRAGKATKWDSYAAGFRAGLEAAAKACDIAVQQADDHLAEQGHSVIAAATRMEAKHLAGVIRALSPSPSATVQTQTDALPRPEPEPK